MKPDPTAQDSNQGRDVSRGDESDAPSSASSQWSTPAMRAILSQVTDDMLDASAPGPALAAATTENTVAEAPGRRSLRRRMTVGERIPASADKENMGPPGPAPSRAWHPTGGGPGDSSTAGRRVPLAPTQANTRNDTPYPARTTAGPPRGPRTSAGDPLSRAPLRAPSREPSSGPGRSVEGAPAEPVAAAAPVAHTTHTALPPAATPRPELGKRAVDDRSPPSARIAEGRQLQPKRARTIFMFSDDEDVFSHSGSSSIVESASSARSSLSPAGAATGAGAPAREGSAALAGASDADTNVRGAPAARIDDENTGGGDAPHAPPGHAEESRSGDDFPNIDDGLDEPRTGFSRLVVRVAADFMADHMRETVATREAAKALATIERTLTLEGGFAHVDVANPGWIFENQKHDQLAAWPGFSGGKVIATVFGRGALDGSLEGAFDPTVGIIEATVGRLLRSETVKASPPIPIVPPSAPNRPPFGILVFNLMDDEVDELLDLRCLSTPDVSIFLFLFGIQVPRLVLNFGGISNRTDAEVRRMAVVNMRMEHNAEALLALVALSPELTAGHSARRALHDIIQSTTVTSSAYLARRAVPFPVYSLLVDIPVTSAATWIKWRDTLRGFSWSDNEMGSITVRDGDGVRCDGCHSQTHFHWACPFAALSDWKGTMPATSRRNATGNGGRGSRDGVSSGWRGRASRLPGA